MTDLISIIVPVYNVEKYLERCMNSLLNQTYDNIEIILVDDGSPDNCPKMCDEYALKDNRVKVIHKQNAGLGFARNSGLEIANGQYIVFVDSDDYVTTDMCEKLYNAAVKNNSDVVYGGIYYTDGQKINKESKVPTEQLWKEGKEFLLEMIATKPSEKNDTIIEVSVWKALFKKEIFDKYSIKFVSEREFISEDVIFDIDYLQHATNIVIIPDAVYYYVNNPASLSKTFRTDRFSKVKILYKEVRRKLEPLYAKNIIDERCGRFLIARARTNIKQIVKHKKIIGKYDTKCAIKSICEDVELVQILNSYPISKLPIKYALVAYLIKYKLYYILNIVLK